VNYFLIINGNMNFLFRYEQEKTFIIISHNKMERQQRAKSLIMDKKKCKNIRCPSDRWQELENVKPNDY